MPRLALVGDYSPKVIAHQAIPLALERARDELSAALTWDWVHTSTLADAAQDLAGFDAVWLAPASPYANMDGALAAVRWARETGRPCLGTCGGFQHALIEIARDVGGLAGADHAESNPAAAVHVIVPLACALIEKSTRIRFAPGSRLGAIYGSDSAEERYHCSYGPNPLHRPALERAGVRFTAFDDAGEIRGGELPARVHPFFVGTLFQPERAALRAETPPLVRAFVAAIGK